MDYLVNVADSSKPISKKIYGNSFMTKLSISKISDLDADELLSCSKLGSTGRKIDKKTRRQQGSTSLITTELMNGSKIRNKLT